MDEEKIKEVFADEAFVKELLALEEPEAVQKALAGKDIEISVEEVKQIGELLTKKINGELNDKNLNEVAGGSLIFGAFVAGALACTSVGGVAGYYCYRQHW